MHPNITSKILHNSYFDQVVERVLGWIMKLFPGGPSRRRPSKHLWFYNIFLEKNLLVDLCALLPFLVARSRVQFVYDHIYSFPCFSERATQDSRISFCNQVSPAFHDFFLTGLLNVFLCHFLLSERKKIPTVVIRLWQWERCKANRKGWQLY